MRSTRNPNPVYDRPSSRPQAQLAETPAVARECRLQDAAERNAALLESRPVLGGLIQWLSISTPTKAGSPEWGW